MAPWESLTNDFVCFSVLYCLSKNTRCNKWKKRHNRSAQLLEGSVLRVGTMHRLDRDAWSMVKLRRQATNEPPPPPSPPYFGQVVVLGLCILSAYLIRRNRFYYLPESAAAILVGVVVGGMAKIFYPTKDELDFLSFNSVRPSRSFSPPHDRDHVFCTFALTRTRGNSTSSNRTSATESNPTQPNPT